MRILLADDHAVVRNGFRMILAAQHDMEVVGEVSNGREAVELAGRLMPDVVVMDVIMPELNGIEADRPDRAQRANPGALDAEGFGLRPRDAEGRSQGLSAEGLR
jgi:DNA-binding NarL/FixJ family response regulator